MNGPLRDHDAQSVSALLGDSRFQAIFDGVNDAIFIMSSTTGEVIEVNQPGCRMFGYDRAELIGRNAMGLLTSGIYPYTEEMAFERVGKTAALGDPEIVQWQSKTRAGVLLWTEISVRYAVLDDKPVMISIVRDVTERRRLEDERSYLAEHDELTGLANRSAFRTAVDQAIEQSRRSSKTSAVLILDLDHFKDVNDTLGHGMGDRLLQVVAKRLLAGVRSNDFVARLGGDEFAILVRDQQDHEELSAFASRLILSINEPFQIEGNEIYVGACIGITICGKGTRDTETLMSQADMALYKAKAEGSQTYRFFAESMDQEVRSRILLTDELRLGIPRGQLFLVYQPQVAAKTGAVVGVEALVRWQHAQRGTLVPGDFLRVAESSGLIGEIDQWVLREACRQGRQWIDARIAPVLMSVNISAAQFNVPLELEKLVLAVLAETGFPPHFLELEIGENTLIGLSSENGEMIQRLRGVGVRFSLDDFGTGCSSLSYLRRFAVDRIKIAREFVAELATSNQTTAIVSHIIRLARDLGNQVIAEGVETSDQINLLQGLECDEFQGFYFARPMPADTVVRVLSAGTISPTAPHDKRAA
jgi:diguanylate cyclase (GGDEF)-like protein/PAS domain S-box-containing protein